MDTTTLKYILKQDMIQHAKQDLNASRYWTTHEDKTRYAVIDSPLVRGQRAGGAVCGTRIVDRNLNDELLVDALLAWGVPQNQIMLTYAKEQVIA